MRVITSLAFVSATVVAGAAQGGVALDAVDRGWYYDTGVHFPFLLNYAVGNDVGLTFRNWFVFDLSSVTLPILSAELRLFNPDGSFFSEDGTEEYVLYDIVTDISDLINGLGGVQAYEDLGSGIVYASHLASGADNGATVVIPLNPAAIAELNMTAGLWAIGGALETLDADPFTTEALFGFTADVPLNQTQHVVTLIPAPGAAALLLAGTAVRRHTTEPATRLVRILERLWALVKSESRNL